MPRNSTTAHSFPGMVPVAVAAAWHMMKFMEVMSVQLQLRSLLAESQAPAVSIFVPTHRAGQEIRQDPIRLKNLVRQAERQLINEGTRPAEAHHLLEPVAALVEDAAFWPHQAEGFAVFRSPDVFRTYRVPFPVGEFVAVSDRFYINPLLPLLINETRFYVLALSQKAVRLLDCTRDGVVPVLLSDVPQDIEQTQPEGPTAHLRRHSLPMGGPEGGRFHAHGVGTEDVDMINVKRYFQQAEDGLRQRLAGERVPLILACVEYLAPIYREVSTYRFVLEEIVAGNPDGVPDDELQRKARGPSRIVISSRPVARPSPSIMKGLPRGERPTRFLTCSQRPSKGGSRPCLSRWACAGGGDSTSTGSCWRSMIARSRATRNCWTWPQHRRFDMTARYIA